MIPLLLARRGQFSVNRFSDDSRITGCRELPVTENSAVPIISSKKAAPNPVLDSRFTSYRGFPVNELRIAGDK